MTGLRSPCEQYTFLEISLQTNYLDWIEFQADKINTLTSAASVDVEPIWATLLAKALEGKDVKDLLSNVGAGGGAPATGAAPAAAGGAAAPAAEEKKEEKVEEKEESDDDMVSLVFSVVPCT